MKWNNIDIIVAFVAILAVFGGALPLVKCYFGWRWPVPDSITKSDTVRNKAQLVLRNDIDGHMSAFVSHEISSNGGVKSVVMGSNGGELRDAEQIAETITKANDAITFEIDTHCGSACVYVFTHVPRRKAAGDAMFWFHKGTLDCETLFGGIEFPCSSNNNPRDMEEWAAVISPELPKYFNSCKTHPLTTTRGILLKWAEIEALVAGTAVLSCDEAMTRQR